MHLPVDNSGNSLLEIGKQSWRPPQKEIMSVQVNRTITLNLVSLVHVLLFPLKCGKIKLKNVFN